MVNRTRAAVSFSMRRFVSMIWWMALYRLDRRHGRLTAVICFDSVMDEHSPFGAPKFSMCFR